MQLRAQAEPSLLVASPVFDPVNSELSAVPGLAVDSSLYGNIFGNVATDAADNI